MRNRAIVLSPFQTPPPKLKARATRRCTDASLENTTRLGRLPYSTTSPAVRTVVDPVHRAWIENSVARAVGARMSSPRTVGADLVSVEHLEGSDRLLIDFPYDRCACLIGQWNRLSAGIQIEHPRLPALLQLLAGWDAIILLLDGDVDPVLDAVLMSALAPRIGLAQVAMRASGLTPTVARVLAAAGELPPARVPLAPAMLSRMLTLPDDGRHRVFDAVRSPSEWNVKRLCAACGLTRRSLERLFARVGLPTPATLLSHVDPSVGVWRAKCEEYAMSIARGTEPETGG